MFSLTIDSVLSDISKKVSKLRDLAGTHHNNHLVHVGLASHHEVAAMDQLELGNKANRIADKFDELIK